MLRVLKSRQDIVAGRSELRRLELSHIDSPSVARLRGLGRRLRLARHPGVGDFVKSWDVTATMHYIRERVDKAHPVLDIGAYRSEIPCILHKLGYSNVAGVDLNPRIKAMPYHRKIRYEVADFMRTPFGDDSFQAITAISVIEHGFQSQSLLAEMSRLLRPGGYFVASFDYWPEKIDTTGTRLFGMDWRIFSRDEVVTFLAESAAHGLYPAGDLDFEALDAPISFAGKNYTFAWLALVNRP